ncbi:CPBP family intramembrane glutamic endopeptidase [Salarchaeum sp. JOR-1]|uniref:CPBP family intramembrane glutamic endopeptidase n=1 Tax=Salarchaeum sp. JOR-1 TaxID=2599399 RepID=UPI001198A165|nr:CPBP family intramembrane glutamic endopeptidase [Salarchaeum sp. JOR-1]QDX41725.1 CPBP family intramembrane metalloprotease [Salarchaeum sp. JOR-1]
MVGDGLQDRQLQRSAAPLNDRLRLSLVAAALPVPLAIGLGLGYQELIPGTAYGVVGKNFSYGLASLFVIGGVYALFSPAARAVAFRFDRPRKDELAWALLGFPIGTALYLGATAATEAAGLTMRGYEYTLSDPLTIAAVVFGAVLVSPLAEEILFRGMVLGSLLGRGIHPVVAGGLAILAFGLIHVALLGIAGVLTMCAWAIVSTAIRLRFDNLSGAWLVHQLNNLWGYIVVVAFGLG